MSTRGKKVFNFKCLLPRFISKVLHLRVFHEFVLFVFDVSLQGAATPDGPMSSPKTEARKGLLGMLPRIMASIARLWSAVQSSELLREDLEKTQEYPSFSMGTPKVRLSFELKTMVLTVCIHIFHPIQSNIASCLIKGADETEKLPKMKQK